MSPYNPLARNSALCLDQFDHPWSFESHTQETAIWTIA
jgi:hypothetical protein